MAKQMQTPKIDPLEAAKRGTQPVSSAPVSPAIPHELRTAAPATPQPEDALAAGLSEPAPGPDPELDAEVQVPEPVEAKAPEVFAVQYRHTLSWGSQMITLSPGDEVSDSTYGPGAVERMVRAGVPLKRVGD